MLIIVFDEAADTDLSHGGGQVAAVIAAAAELEVRQEYDELVALASVACAFTGRIDVLIGARFVNTFDIATDAAATAERGPEEIDPRTVLVLERVNVLRKFLLREEEARQRGEEVVGGLDEMAVMEDDRRGRTSSGRAGCGRQLL